MPGEDAKKASVIKTQCVVNKLSQCGKECEEKFFSCLYSNAISVGNNQEKCEIFINEKKFEINGITETRWEICMIGMLKSLAIIYLGKVK